MFVIKDTLVSLDVVEKEFCCDLECCKGCCCVEGDAGAPLTDEEVTEIENILPLIKADMTKEAREVVEKQGISYLDPTGDRVTSIVGLTPGPSPQGEGCPCVFARTDHKGWCYCLIEKAYNQGKIAFKKPISCHLYPIRLTTIGGKAIGDRRQAIGREDEKAKGIVGVEYHRWDICHCARVLGKKNKLKIYQFLKEPLIRRFGQEWYDELCLVAREWERQVTGNR